MSALARKELRSLLPAWITALALVTLPELLVWIATRHKATPPDPVLFWLFGFGILLLGLASFGQEFNAGTFPNLVAQPISRLVIWRIKIKTLMVALLSVSLVFLVAFLSEPVIASHDADLRKYAVLICALIVACGMSGALWTTLLLRQVAMAFWITVLTPIPICLVVAVTAPEDWQPPVMVAALSVYSVIGFISARRIFLHAQDVPWTGGTIPFPSWGKAKSVPKVSSSTIAHKPLLALIWNEIQLHHVSLMLGAVIFVLNIILVLVRRANPEMTEPHIPIAVLFGLWFILWLALPFLIGSVAVAEERRLGTLENQLCLPVTRRLQFAVKFLVAIALSILICAGLPWLIEATGLVSDVRNSPFDAFFAPKDMRLLCGFTAGVTAFSFYASTLTRNTLQAIGVAVVMSLLGAGLVIWCAHPRVIFLDNRTGYARLFGCIGGPVLIVTLLGLALENYKRPLADFNLWRRNVLVLIAVLFGAWTGTSLIYNRSWELLMNFEPPRGPAQLRGPVKPRIFESWRKTYVLLPDGRLWASKNYRTELPWKDRQFGKTEEVKVLIPTDGEFLGSNWVCIASHYGFPAGIQADGSLWSITSSRTNFSATPKLERVGADADWKTAVAGVGFYLALKNDGSLWGWGDNSEGQLGPGPKGFTNGPVRIGDDSDWHNVFAAEHVSIGIKRDGSIWKWGGLNNTPDPKPRRFNGNGAEWVQRTGFYWYDLILYHDGTLWKNGRLPANNLLGHAIPDDFTSDWQQVGTESNLTEIQIALPRLVAVKKDGTLLLNDTLASPIFTGISATWHPSKHRDWLAAAQAWPETTLAVAADGTVSCWFHAAERGDGSADLLGPTRKPLWSLNILTATK